MDQKLTGMKKIKKFILQTFQCWYKDKALTQGAALSFYIITALPAFLLGVFFLATFLLEKQEIQLQIIRTSQLFFGSTGNDIVEQILQNIHTPSFTLPTIISIIFLLFSATAIFEHLQSSFNSMWNIKPKILGVKDFLLNHIILLLMVGVLEVLFIFSLLIESILSLGSDFLSQFVTLPFDLLQPLSMIVSFVLLIIIFVLLFKFLPAAKISWRDSFIGATVTTLLFTGGKFLLGFYLATTNIASAYGATGSLILLLLWIYYSSLTVFLGAEFTQNFANTYGSKIKPKPPATYEKSWWKRKFQS